MIESASRTGKSSSRKISHWILAAILDGRTIPYAPLPDVEWGILRHLLTSAEAKLAADDLAAYRAEIAIQTGVELKGPAANNMEMFTPDGLLRATTLAAAHKPGASFGDVALEITKLGSLAVLGGAIGLGLLGVFRVLGPAKSVLLPSVVHIASLRLNQASAEAAAGMEGITC